jgi:hypothetical protein
MQESRDDTQVPPVITIEPFLTTGATIAVEDVDGWTLRSPDENRGAQFEHILIITRGRQQNFAALLSESG